MPSDYNRSNKQYYSAVKSYSEQSKVPFSPLKRNRVERSYNKFDHVNGYGSSVSGQNYTWKVPTYDLKK